MDYLSPLPCLHCGHTPCRSSGGRPAPRHVEALMDDSLWSLAHIALRSGSIPLTLDYLTRLNRRHERTTS